MFKCKTPASFKRLIKEFPYENKGIFFSELWMFLEACRKAEVNTIFESGAFKGFSTRILAAGFAGPIISIDRTLQVDHEEFPGHVEFCQGEAQAVILERLEALSSADYNIGILLDGPKGTVALDLKDECFKFRWVKVVAIHDLPQGVGSPSFHSHDEAQYCAMDNMVSEEYQKKYPQGPGLGIFTR